MPPPARTLVGVTDGDPTAGPEPFFDASVDPFAPPPPRSEPGSAQPGEPAEPPAGWGYGGPWAPPGYPPPPGSGPSPPPGAPYPPYPPPGWQGGPWGSPYPQPRSTNGFAVAALCCGIGGLVTDGIAGVLGVIFGIVALRQIARDGQGGRGLAIAGIVVGAVTILLGIFLLVAWLDLVDGGSSTGLLS